MPHNANLEILKYTNVNNNWLLNAPENRISWNLNILWIKIPAHKNNKALNKAWERRWKKANLEKPNDKILIIKPNWLKVDKAIIFLKSIS